MNAMSLDVSAEKTFSIAAPGGFVIGWPAVMLRLEGLAMLIGASWAFAQTGQGWGLFAALFLVPDLSMLGYLIGRRIGAAIYNAGHSYLAPAACLVVGLSYEMPVASAVAMIWAAHIGFDRMVGYGLKYARGFGFTHLGLKGRAAA